MNHKEKQTKLMRLLSTKEGKHKLSESLQPKLMCGGLDYINGKPFYRSGGKLYTPEEFSQLKKKLK